MANELRIDGLDDLIDRIKNLPVTIAEEVSFEIQQSGDTIVAAAKRDAPTDIGGIAGGISKVVVDSVTVDIVSAMSYSAFVEFGTRTRVQIPAGYEEYAKQFKGLKGSGGIDEMFANILDWVKRKGLSGTYSVKTQKRTGKASQRDSEDFDVAYLIVHSILTKGIHPHPFFFKNIEAEKPKLLERIKKIIEA